MILLAGNAYAAGKQIAPVAALFDTLAELNGDKAIDGADAAVPVLCFGTGESSLPNAAGVKDPKIRKQSAARRALIEAAVANLARRIVDAHRESGSPDAPLVIRIIGHADSATPEGKPNYNESLSYQRAVTIAKLLRAKLSKAGGARINLEFRIEGRSTFDPWPNRSDSCAVSTTPAAELASVSLSPIPADRRVEIEIYSGALVGAGPSGDRRLRIYRAGTMPWTPVSVLLKDSQPAVPECAALIAKPVKLVWIPQGLRNLIDYKDGNLAVRLRAEPVYAPKLTHVRVYLDLARDNTGVGIPGYWSVHERLDAFLKGLKKDNADLDRLAKCLYGSGADASRFAQAAADIMKSALEQLPKDIDGLMAATHGLHRNLRYVDLRPGMKLLMKSSFADPRYERLQLGQTDAFRLIADPIDPCSADPAPRAADKNDPALADRASFQFSIGDPFLAWMARSNLWLTCATGLTESAEVSAASPATEAAAASDSTSVSRIDSYSQLELLFSNGPVRLFLPLSKNTAPLDKKTALDPVQVKDRGGMLVSADRALTDDLTRKAATIKVGSVDPAAFNINKACSDNGVAGPRSCGQLFSQETLTPFVSFRVEGSAAEQPLGIRVVHVVPSKLYDACFKNHAAGSWPADAQLSSPLNWMAPSLPAAALIDRRDCRLLGLPMVSGGSVSW